MDSVLGEKNMNSSVQTPHQEDDLANEKEENITVEVHPIDLIPCDGDIEFLRGSDLEDSSGKPETDFSALEIARCRLLAQQTDIMPLWMKYNVHLMDSQIERSLPGDPRDLYTHGVPPDRRKKSTKPKKYKCNTCRKTFAKKGHLTDHIRSHTEEKPFLCEICSMRFAQRSGLWYHVRTHSGERPHKCPTCSKAFSQRVNLANHIRIHTGEKPFCCLTCNKRFSRRHHLVRHVKCHTG